MLPIITYPDPILARRMPEFDFANPVQDPETLQTAMLESMLANRGMGLSANQVGIETRVFVMGHSQHPEMAQAFFNPIVVATVDSIEELEEGCLSFPGVYAKIKRPRKILARWQNYKAEWQESEFTGYDCKCFLHELDHLEGIVFKDRTSPLKWALAVKKASKRKY